MFAAMEYHLKGGFSFQLAILSIKIDKKHQVSITSARKISNQVRQITRKKAKQIKNKVNKRRKFNQIYYYLFTRKTTLVKKKERASTIQVHTRSFFERRKESQHCLKGEMKRRKKKLMTIFSISDADLLYLLIIYTNSKEEQKKNSHERKLQI